MKKIIWMSALCLLFIISFGCNNSPEAFRVGIVTYQGSTNEMLEGFMAGMEVLGYKTDRDIIYTHGYVPEDQIENAQLIDQKINELMDQEVDLLLALGKSVALRAKVCVDGTDVPVLFSGGAWPVEDGLVESIKSPRGNLTGVKLADSISKAMEWLVSITGAKKVYLPYDPGDSISIAALDGPKKIATQLGVELVLQAVHSVEEAGVAIENLPEDVNAVFRIPSALLDSHNTELSQAAIKRGVAVVAANQLDEAVLGTFTSDLYGAGEKLARMAQQINAGVKPRDLPIETAEVLLTINLQTAEKIGLDVPYDVLVQADKIIN